jgi:HAD superfamily hydrolase (TIGR01549 family)
MINTIIFDLDGTLINLNVDFKTLVPKVQTLLQMDEKPSPFLETIIQRTKENITLRNKIWLLIDKMEEDSVPKSEIFPETIQVLNELKKKGYNLSLVTLQGKKAVQLIFQKFSLSNYFHPIITRENSYLRDQQIEFALKILKLSKEQVLMIGDRTNDVTSSQKIGVNCILIRRRYNPSEGTIVIKSLSELFQYL